MAEMMNKEIVREQLIRLNAEKEMLYKVYLQLNTYTGKINKKSLQDWLKSEKFETSLQIIRVERYHSNIQNL